MDDELKELAALALRNAFYAEFSSMVNAYLVASNGLIDGQEAMMHETANVYSRNVRAHLDHEPSIYTLGKTNPSFNVTTHSTMLEAISCDDASAVCINGIKVFERDEANEWRWVGG